MILTAARRLHCSALLFVLAITCNAVVGSLPSTSWWSVAVSGCGVRNSDAGCPNCAQFRSNGTFTRTQATQCQEEPAILPAIARGTRHSIIACQNHFNESRWNCSTFYGQHLFGSFIATQSTRERGALIVYFIAGAIWGLADDCHNQRLPNCPCIRDNPLIRSVDSAGNVIFESCKADYNYALGKVDELVTNQINASNFKAKIDIHNINVGKRVVNRTIATCRCHGISGTCTVQTCYSRVVSVEEVGETVFQDYGGAIRVEEDDRGEITPENPNSDPPTEDDIIFYERSPDFCVANNLTGIVGVAHRKCDPNSNNRNACSTICCNYGHYKSTKVIPFRECRFICCNPTELARIECSYTHNVTKTEYHCNPPPTDAPTPIP